MLINELFFCRPTDCTAGVPGTAQFSRECLEVEGSLQNPQEIKRAIQVLILRLLSIMTYTAAQQTKHEAVICLMNYKGMDLQPHVCILFCGYMLSMSYIVMFRVSGYSEISSSSSLGMSVVLYCSDSFI